MRDDQRVCLQCGEMVTKRVAAEDRLQAVPAGVPAWIAFDATAKPAVDLPASRLSRVIAATVDGAIFAVLASVGFALFASEPDYSFDATTRVSFADLGVPVWLVVSLWLSQMLYHVVFPVTAWRGTPGKKLLGIRITGLDGERMNIFQSFMRHLCQSVFWWMLVPLMMLVGVAVFAVPIAVLWLMGDGRSPWDSMAGTRVVD
jgi:uncharacterized RDD family membrane protein YckC